MNLAIRLWSKMMMLVTTREDESSVQDRTRLQNEVW